MYNKKYHDLSENTGFAICLAEYVFMRAVDAYNQELRAQGKAENKDDFEIPFIFTREARVIHTRFRKELVSEALKEAKEKGKDPAFVEHLSALVEKAFADSGRDITDHKNCFADPDDNKDKRYNDFCKYYKEDGMIPLSPYAQANAGKGVFLASGEKCLFLKKEDAENYYNGVMTPLWEVVDSNAEVHEFKKPSERAFYANSVADNLGISELLMYTMNDGRRHWDVEQKIIDAFREETTQEKDRNGKSLTRAVDKDGSPKKDANGNNLYIKSYSVDRDLLNKAFNILDTIASKGYSFNLVPTDRKGQLEAEIEELGIKVRIIDVSDEAFVNGKYNYNCVGRVFYPRKNINIRNSIMGAGSKAGNVISENVRNMETRAFLYAIGENVIDRRGNELTLEEGVMKLESKAFHRIYKDMGRANTGLVVGIDAKDSNSAYSLTVTRGRQANPACQEDPNYVYENGTPVRDENRRKIPVSAEENIAKKVESARANFITEINLDGILNEDKKYQNGEERPDSLPPALLSENNDIAEIQNDIWNYISGDRVLIDPEKEQQYASIDSMDLSAEEKAKLKKECLFTDRNFFDNNWSYLSKKADVYIGRFDRVPDGEGNLVRKINPVHVLQLADQQFSSRFEDNDAFSAWLGKAGLGKDDFLPFDLNDSEQKSAYNSLVDRSVQFQPNKAVAILSKADEMRALAESAGTEFEKENLLKAGAFYENVEKTIKSSLGRVGIIVNDEDILIDDQGVVKYSGVINNLQGINSVRQSNITGYIGQIVAPDRYGAVVPKFKSGSNTVMAPGYEAYFEQINPSKPKPAIERMVLSGYDRTIMKSIKRQINEDFFSVINRSFEESDEIVLGRPYSVNSDLRKVTHSTMRGGENYVQEFLSEGHNETDLVNRMMSLTGKVKMAKDYVDNAGYSTYTEVMKHTDETGKLNDNARNAFNNRGRNFGNMIPDEFAGYFDMLVTAKTENTGNVLYLAHGAKVDPNTGHIEPARNADGSINAEAVCEARFRDPNLKYIEYDSSERIAMTRTNFESKLTTVEKVGFAEVSLGGWNTDDGVVISSDLAQKILVPDAKHPGEFRHLMIGDKLSDLHGNKGVISLIVARNMSDEEAKEKGIAKVVKIFRDNPDLDYASSPYSAISRMNGGTYAEANDSETKPLLIDGKELKDHIGYITVDVLSQTVDHKTKVDDAERNFGSQAAWASVEQGAWNVLKELYGKNDKAVKTFQEYLNVLGGSVKADGNIDTYSFVVKGVPKKLFMIPDVPGEIVSNEELDKLSDEMRKRAFERLIRRMVSSFEKEINQSGGYLLLPFQVEMANGTLTPEIGRLDEDTKQWVTDKLGIDASDPNRKKMYLFPVMSPKLRKDTQLLDGSVKYNEFDLQYLRIYEFAVKYKFVEEIVEKLENNSIDQKLSVNIPISNKIISFLGGEKGSGEKNYDLTDCSGRETALRAIRNEATNILKSSKAEYDKLVAKLTGDNGPLDVTSKRNFVKRSLLGNRVDMATMVISENPTLNVNEVCMSTAHAIELGVLDKNGKRKTFTNTITGQTEEVGLLIYRDPVLRDGAARYVHVVINDDYEGIGINPVAYKCQDGDFDGDTEAVCCLKEADALTHASMLMSYEANMWDKSQKAIRTLKMSDDSTVLSDEEAKALEEAGKKVWDVKVKPLYMNDGLDFAAGEAANPELKNIREDIENRVALSCTKYSEYNKTATKFVRSHNADSTTEFDEAVKKTGIPGNNYKEFATFFQNERKALLDEYSKYVHDDLDASIGYHSISFGSTSEHAESLLQTVLDGSKGSVDKLAQYLSKSLNIKAEIGKDENGEKTLSHVEDVDHLYKRGRRAGFTGRQRNGSLLATGAKTFWAGNVGEISKKLFSSVGRRSVYIRCALELGSRVQQALMQAKKDVEQANAIVHNVTSVYPDFMNGRKIAKYDSDGNEIPLEDCAKIKGVWKTVKQKEQMFAEVDPVTGKVKRYVPQRIALKDFGQPLSNVKGNPKLEAEYNAYLKKNNLQEVKNTVCYNYVQMEKDEWLAIAEVYTADKDGLNNPSVEPDLLKGMAMALQPEGTDHIIGVTELQTYDLRKKKPNEKLPARNIGLISDVVYRKTPIVNLLTKLKEDEVLTLFGDLNDKMASYMATNSVRENNAIIQRNEQRKKAGLTGEMETVTQFVDDRSVDREIKRKESKHSISAEEAGDLVVKSLSTTGGMKM